MMIDSHIHLANKQYDNPEKIINEMIERDLEGMMVIGCDEDEIKNVLNLVRSKEKVWAAIGYHPIEYKNVTQEMLDKLEEQLSYENVIALGEIGLDYHWFPAKPIEQSDLFEKQIKIAQKLDLPIVIHSRDALEETYTILKKYAPLKGVIHSFSGNASDAKKFIDLGLLIGITGPITFKNEYNKKEVAREIDLEYLLIETDGPYLTPVPFRGKINQPEYVKYVAQEIANQKNIDVNTVILETTKNFKKIFLGE